MTLTKREYQQEKNRYYALFGIDVYNRVHEYSDEELADLVRRKESQLRKSLEKLSEEAKEKQNVPKDLAKMNYCNTLNAMIDDEDKAQREYQDLIEKSDSKAAEVIRKIKEDEKRHYGMLRQLREKECSI